MTTDNHPEVLIGCVANLWSKMMLFKNVGDVEVGHEHLFDHMTLLAKGKLRVNVDGVDSEFSAPHMIYIKAGKVHELTALEPDTLAYCIHPLRDGDGVGDILDPSSVPDGITYHNIFDFAKPLIKDPTCPPQV